MSIASEPRLDTAPSSPKRWRYRIAVIDPSHHRGCSLPRYCDVAFNFHDIGAECDVLAHLAQRRGTGAPRTVLELAAGPARHAREWARGAARAGARVPPQ